MTKRVVLVAFVALTLVLVIFGSNSIAAGMTSGEGMEDMTSRIVPNVVVLGVAVLLGWAPFGKRH